MRSPLPFVLALGAVMVGGLGGRVARADGLSADETRRLVRGETVVRTQALRHADERYVGGVAYAILDDSAEDVADLVADVGAWTRILPKTRSARRVGVSGNDTLVEMTNGTGLVQATYTMRVRREGQLVRFWMDLTRHHDIEDVWGFVRAEPMADGRTLVAYGILVDMGSGILRDLFEDRVRTLALSVPDQLRDLLVERAAAGQRASR